MTTTRRSAGLRIAVSRLDAAARSWRLWMVRRPEHAALALLVALQCEARAHEVRRLLLEVSL